MALVDRVTEVVTPVVNDLGVELVDVEHKGAVLRVVVDQAGGIGLDRVAEVTKAVSTALDDADPLPGHYTLEVSSPGLERPLRTPEHFARAVGQKVSMKTKPVYEGERRLVGVLAESGEHEVVIDAEGIGTVSVPFQDIDKARTVFDWGPAPKPGKGSKPGAAKRSAVNGKAERESEGTGRSQGSRARSGVELRTNEGGAEQVTAVGEQQVGDSAMADDR
jgi:ribosome maturation factor RimP